MRPVWAISGGESKAWWRNTHELPPTYSPSAPALARYFTSFVHDAASKAPPGVSGVTCDGGVKASHRK